jgi:hypothetical protein
MVGTMEASLGGSSNLEYKKNSKRKLLLTPISLIFAGAFKMVKIFQKSSTVINGSAPRLRTGKPYV